MMNKFVCKELNLHPHITQIRLIQNCRGREDKLKYMGNGFCQLTRSLGRRLARKIIRWGAHDDVAQCYQGSDKTEVAVREAKLSQTYCSVRQVNCVPKKIFCVISCDWV